MRDDPGPEDVILIREPPDRMAPGAKCRVSIPQFVVQHSPGGFEWGYGGSGPSDLALNILHMHVPPFTDGFPPVSLFRGITSLVAWLLHLPFCREFIAGLPDAGGVIRADDVRAWLSTKWSKTEGFADRALRQYEDAEGRPLSDMWD